MHNDLRRGVARIRFIAGFGRRAHRERASAARRPRASWTIL